MKTSKTKGRRPKWSGLPPKQGLYDPAFEHDACGVGFVVDVKGRRSHRILQQGLEVLTNLNHRGACGSEVNTGDGAGVLLQMPHRFLVDACKKNGIAVPNPGEYGCGIVFLPRNPTVRRRIEERFEQIVQSEGQTVIGWRTVPTRNSMLGDTAKSCEPFMKQVFIARNPEIQDELAFERKLYVIRKRAYSEIRTSTMEGAASWYVASLSHKTLVYKGMLLTQQLAEYFPDLADPRMETALALVHSRFSTNTFPSWDRAHPYRYVAHNGEINTVRGNANWMHAREALFDTDAFGDDVGKILPIINPNGSDSAMFDNTLELLVLAGRSLPHAVMMMIPEPWSNHQTMDDAKRAFYQYHSSLMEPWDGPASIAFTDGKKIGAVLDRNGLRPSRYYVTKDGLVVMASEAGVLEIAPENVLTKGRLQPGRMFLVDTELGRIVDDEEIKRSIASERPYRQWLNEHQVHLNDLPAAPEVPAPDHETLLQRQIAFGYTFEDERLLLAPMAQSGVEAVGSMGNDTPLAVLSNKPRLLYDYFKQLFAQVTNPPIDCIREEIITSAETRLGSEGNLLNPQPADCRRLELQWPILTNDEFAKIRRMDLPALRVGVLPSLFRVTRGEKGLVKSMEEIRLMARRMIEEEEVNVLILSDRGVNREFAPIPALLAVAGLHHYLIREGLRTRVSLVLETGEAREVHHFCPADRLWRERYQSLRRVRDDRRHDPRRAPAQYRRQDGLQEHGESRDQGRHQGHGEDGYFRDPELSRRPSVRGGGTASGRHRRVLHVDLLARRRHRHGRDRAGSARASSRCVPGASSDGHALPVGGLYQWRSNGEFHLFNPESIHRLQKAVRNGSYTQFREYSRLVNEQATNLCTLRGLLDFKVSDSIPLEDVESIESIVKRFKTGAMSYGSISKEAHETLAIAMNRIGGKSNTGEGGEDPDRFKPLANGDSKNSAIKQVASGRFGVTSEYLVSANEIQIKMAQGAKPGEGGQLPGAKVYPWIAKTRLTTAGVGLISPPPHHDIYSIEDLAELIHDLKNANRHARISVKLVAEVGVGTVAAGVAKAHADVVLISGYDGGTGASPQTSIAHAGLPWELGVAETHQTLVMNDLRSRIAVETDGQLKTGRDVVVAALLGAEEFGFATAPLVATGCIMMRVCHLNTCPAGIATQDPKLREKFAGKPEHVVNFMRFVAMEMRELMAQLGFRTVEEMVGRVDRLEARKAVDHWKAKGLDFSNLLYQPDAGPETGRYCQIPQDHGLEKSLDLATILELCGPAIERGERVRAELPIRNVNRVVGTITGSEVTRKFGAAGLPEDTIDLRFKGSAGQSFGAFVPRGMTLSLEGDANDYVGKGLSGGKLIIYPPAGSTFTPYENIIVGNVALYGATSGEAYISGMAGERFCVRNSGVHAVVEAVGDHGCEYMTGGRVIVLGPAGRNFGAGMSGGVAYVLDERGDFAAGVNREMVDVGPMEEPEEIAAVRAMIEKHLNHTKSARARQVLDSWAHMAPKFVRVMPRDYSRMLKCIARAHEQGLTGEDAIMVAFEENARDLARVGGN